MLAFRRRQCRRRRRSPSASLLARSSRRSVLVFKCFFRHFGYRWFGDKRREVGAFLDGCRDNFVWLKIHLLYLCPDENGKPIRSLSRSNTTARWETRPRVPSSIERRLKCAKTRVNWHRDKGARCANSSLSLALSRELQSHFLQIFMETTSAKEVAKILFRGVLPNVLLLFFLYCCQQPFRSFTYVCYSNHAREGERAAQKSGARFDQFITPIAGWLSPVTHEIGTSHNNPVCSLQAPTVVLKENGL